MINILKIKEDWDNTVPAFRNKVTKILNSGNEKASGIVNPFLNKDGNLINPYIDYQKVLENGSVSAKAKDFIQQATGLSPTIDSQNLLQTFRGNSAGGSNATAAAVAPENSVADKLKQAPASSRAPVTDETGEFKNSVGKRVADTAKYNNSAAKGQCVWYVRGRAEEKLGIKLGSMGNGNQMYYNAKKDAQLAATADNIKPNILVSYGKGTSSAGQKYGHVIFVEDVIGDTVYYTEGGSGYYKNGTDGVVKTTTKEGLLKGINNQGGHMGSNVLGFVDLSKYK